MSTKKKTTDNRKTTGNRKRSQKAVIVAGSRTPFVRAFKEYVKHDTIELGTWAVKSLLEKTELPRGQIDALYWGGVVIPTASPNIGREILLDLGLPTSIEAFTVTRACTSSLLSISLAAAAIERGESQVIIAGGSDSTSNAEIPLPKKLMQTVGPVAMNSKAGPVDWLNVVLQLAPFYDVLPKKPKIAERSTGQLMGEAAEEMAQRNGIGREEQDAFAVASHLKAAKAITSGRYSNEVVPVMANGKKVYRDTIVRSDTSIEKMAKLRPVFAKNGTLTAGNSSALTDGAAVTLLMSEEKASELGYTPLATIEAWHYCGVNPFDQLLLGPAIAMPRILKEKKLTIDQIDFFDIHEAFAAQVLAVRKLMASESFARERLGFDEPMGLIPMEKLNVHGGSIALGHPFGATGARMVTTMANELALSGKQYALLGLCAAGGLGGAMLLQGN